MFAYGPISGLLVATTGNADVSSYDLVTAEITAGTDISVFAYGGATGTTTAGRDLYFTSLGVTGGVYQAPRDVVVFSAQVLTGTVDAGRDAVAIGLTTTQLPVTAGQDAFVFSGGDQQGSVTGGGDAVLVSLGSVSGSVITAGQSALLYAVGSVTTVSVVGLDAALVSWDSVGGPSVVTGTDSAFAFTYGNFYGTVNSPAGDAGLVTYGNVFATTVSGALSAIALTVGNFDGNVTGGTFAGAISLTNFQGNVTSGGDAVLLTEGDGSAHLTAANDAFVWSLSDFNGIIDADRDAGAVTYGDLNANIHAGRDLIGAAAVGSITGSLAADNNIGNLLTYGEMAASVQALNPNSVTGGGSIGDVVAWGPVSGSVTASSSIGSVRSAGDITSSIVAPIIGSITPFDSTVMVDNPLPVTPASIKADVQADGATAYAGVLADKSQFQSDRTTFLSDMAQEKQDTADDITQSRSEIVTQNATDLTANQNDLAADKATTVSQITVERLDVESDYQEMSQSCTTDEGEFQEAINDSLTVNALAWIDSANDADASRVEADLAYSNSLGQRSGALDQEATKVQQEKNAARNMRSGYADAVKDVLGVRAILESLGTTAIFALLPAPIGIPAAAIAFSVSSYNAGEEIAGDWVDEAGILGWQRAYVVFGAGVYANPVIRSGYQMIWGMDPLTGEQLTAEYLIEQTGPVLFRAGLEMLRDAALYKLVRVVTTPCGGIFTECFVGETRVLTAELPDAGAATMVSAEESAIESDLNDVLAAICIAIGAGGTLLMQRHSQLVRPRGRKPRILDALFHGFASGRECLTI